MAVLLPTMSTTLSLPLNHMTDATGDREPLGSPIANIDTSSASLPTAKKPKLSLQTTSLSSTYGSLTRGLAPDPQSIYTPTTSNTISNTWDLSYRPSPVLRTESPRPLQISRIQPQVQQDEQPYGLLLPFGVRSILKNSPLQVKAASMSASPRDSKRRLFFPQPKKVNFRRNLEDIVYTTQYTARHSDLSSSEDDSTEDDSAADSISGHLPLQTSPPPTRKRKDRRDSGVSIDAANIIDETTTKQGKLEVRAVKTCKRRKWKWSLSDVQQPSPESQADQQSSDGSNSGSYDEEGIAQRFLSSPCEIKEQTDDSKRIA